MKRSHIASCLICVLAASLTAAVAQFASPGGDFECSWNTVDGGGGLCSGGAFSLTATIGQPDAGAPMSGGTFTLAGGFLTGGVQPEPQCPADIAPLPNGDGLVNITDLLFVIANWGSGPGNAADVNGDNLVNITDLLAVIAGWGACP